MPAAPHDPAGLAAPVRHRPWSTLLLSVHLVGLAAGTVVLGYGAWAVVRVSTTAPADRGPWDGLGALLLLLVGACVLVLAVPLLVMTVQGRGYADVGHRAPLFSLAAHATCLGTLAAVVALQQLERGGLAALPVVGAYTLCALRVLVVTRVPRRREGSSSLAGWH